MSLSGLLIFAGIYFLAVALPGPGVAAVIARSLAHGTQGAIAFIAGFLIGDLVWFVFAATGLAALAQTAAMVFVAVKYAGVVYLLYLAYRLWTSPVRPAEESAGQVPAELSTGASASEARVDRGQSASRLFLGSLALTLGNPKTMIFFLALLPTVVRLETLSVAGFLEIATTICIVLPLVLGGYVLAAARARRIFSSSRALRNLNRGSGVAMASAAIVVASR
ncbi:MAG TPA: LysE family translocator [Steroidobacteraceae bacterium]|jgi:threonine/homoserine/homoserine lactone efflux protein